MDQKLIDDQKLLEQQQKQIDDEEVSPASIITKTIITWNTLKIGSGITIKDSIATFGSGGFRFAKSNESFTSGRHTFRILFKKGNVQEIGSIGVGWNKDFNLQIRVPNYIVIIGLVLLMVNQMIISYLLKFLSIKMEMKLLLLLTLTLLLLNFY